MAFLHIKNVVVDLSRATVKFNTDLLIVPGLVYYG
jgi:hypothetical protein